MDTETNGRHSNLQLPEAIHLIELTRHERDDALAKVRTMELALAKTAHELRTPLSAVMNWIGVARQRVAYANEVLQALDVIERNTQLQARLVGDLFDHNCAAAGKLAIFVQEIQLEDVARLACDTLAPHAAVRSISLNAELEHVAVQGDPLRLLQVLVNLIANAIKFSVPGSVVAVTLKRAGDSALLSVTDAGRGLCAEDLEWAFEPFWQSDDASSAGGLGLGLSIVRSLTLLHAGQVRAYSEGLGKGCTFVVTLPTKQVDLNAGA